MYYYFRNEAFNQLQCMLNPVDYPQTLLIGGHKETLFEFDYNQQEIVRTVSVIHLFS